MKIYGQTNDGKVIQAPVNSKLQELKPRKKTVTGKIPNSVGFRGKK